MNSTVICGNPTLNIYFADIEPTYGELIDWFQHVQAEHFEMKLFFVHCLMTSIHILKSAVLVGFLKPSRELLQLYDRLYLGKLHFVVLLLSLIEGEFGDPASLETHQKVC